MNKELPLDTKIIVAVSGGVDSVYMLQHLVLRGYTNLAVAHFNHRIRNPAETSADAKLVQRMADDLGVICHWVERDITHIAAQKKQSIELTAREERRKFFDSVMSSCGYEWLALGHHADDQAETVLFNLLRGTGVHGLAGMKRIDEKQKIFRPLLELTKSEIYESANNLRLVWNEDDTNHGVENDRAWIRNVIMPLVEGRRKGTGRVLYETARRFQELSDFLKDSAYEWLKYRENGFPMVKFNSQHKALQAEILGVLWENHNGSRKNFNNKVVNEVTRWLSSTPEGGTSVYFGNGRLNLKQGRVFFT